MSTKTLRKRIALVAVSALGAGLLSVVSVPSANAATGGTPVADKLYMATTASVNGATTNSATVDLGTLVADGTSLGLLASSGEGTTRTAVLLNGGVMQFVIGAGTTNSSVIVDGPCYISGATTYTAVSNTRQSIFISGGGAGYVLVTATGVGTCTVSQYDGAGVTTTARDGGTLQNKITTSIVAASQGGAAYAPYTYIKADSADITSPATMATNVDVAVKFSNSAVAYVGVNINDAYGVTLGAGVLQASATGGAVVRWENNPVSTSTASDVHTSASYATLHVSQGVTNAHKPISTTVTFTWNGAVIGTKSLQFLGDASKITVYNNVISNLSTAATTAAVGLTGANYKVYDSAGNWIDEPAPLTYDSSTVNGIVTAVAVERASQASASSWVGTSGRLVWDCNATTGGAKDVTVYLYNAQNQKISTTLPAKCAGDTYTFKVSTDKATYAPGEIISVTLQGLDAAGNPANARHLLSPKNVIASGAFASTVDEPTTADLLADTGLDGKVTYRFIATQTEGTYSVSASMPVNASGQTAQTASVTIKSTSTAVSNADVLKAIVSLIASINKQIAALQKALLKK
jgi:hypothetical protein